MAPSWHVVFPCFGHGRASIRSTKRACALVQLIMHTSRSCKQRAIPTYALFCAQLYLIASGMSLLQVRTLLVGLHNVTARRNANSIVETIRPYLKYVNDFFQQIFGKAETYKFTLTHVCLVAVMLAVLAVADAVS